MDSNLDSLLENETIKQEDEKITLIVGGFPASTTKEELVNYFSNYGALRNVKLLIRRRLPPKAFVTFNDKEIAENVLKSPHSFKGRWIFLSRKLYTIPNNTKTGALSITNVLPQLQEINTTDEKIKKLCSILSLSDQEMLSRQKMLKTIEDILRTYYSNCQLIMYGSSSNGYGFKNCDVDLLFLPTPEYCNSNANPENALKKIPSLKDVNEGKVTKESLYAMNETSHLIFILRVLRKHLPGICNSCFIPARCPIINFVYDDIVCDLSCSNRLVLYNTLLLKLFGDIDPRIQPLIKTLRYWAKSLGFIKSGLLSSYAFTLLIVFFLQNTEPRILPSVQELIQLSDKTCLVSGWNCSFIDDLKRIPPSKNDDSIEKLMELFFKFYLNFDFIQYIVCPLTSKPLLIEELKKSSDERLRDFKITSMCVQDPLELSHNVSKSVHQRALNDFKKAFYLASMSFKNSPLSNDYFHLESIFNDEFSSTLSNICNKKFSRISFTFCLDFTHDVYMVLSQDEVNTIELWYQLASHAVYDILTEGLLMDCEIVDFCPASFNNHHMDVNSSSHTHAPNEKIIHSFSDCNHDAKDVYADIELIMSIQCCVYAYTWVGRNNAQRVVELNPELQDPLIREKNISLQLVKTTTHGFSDIRYQYVFLCDLYRYKKYSIQDILITITPLTKNKGFSSLATFLKSYIPNILEQIILNGNSSDT